MSVPSDLSKLRYIVDNDTVKKLSMIIWLQKVMLLMIRY